MGERKDFGDEMGVQKRSFCSDDQRCMRDLFGWDSGAIESETIGLRTYFSPEMHQPVTEKQRKLSNWQEGCRLFAVSEMKKNIIDS